jgi:hypothetical protein
MRQVFITDNKIEYADNRFYKLNENTYIPSVTTVLSVYPKDYFFYEWLKNNGQNSDIIRDNAAESGSKVHHALETLLKGNQITHEGYSLEEWEMVNKGVEFFTRYKFTKIQTEQNFVTDKCGWAGTVDFIGEYNGELWMIDFKTSNYLSETHYLQLLAYKQLASVMGVKIDRMGVLHLKASTRTEKDWQGKGWQLSEVTDKMENELRPVWEATLKIFQHKQKSIIPNIKSFKTKLKLWH